MSSLIIDLFTHFAPVNGTSALRFTRCNINSQYCITVISDSLLCGSKM